MSRNRVWIIPTIVILLVSVAWIFRWEDGGSENIAQQSGSELLLQHGVKTYKIDRWLGQIWVKEIEGNSYREYPLIPTEALEQSAQQAISKDKQLSNQIDDLSKKISEYQKTADDNYANYREVVALQTKYEEEWKEKTGASHYVFGFIILDPSQEKEMALYIENKIPKELMPGYYSYSDARAKVAVLNKQKIEITDSVRNEVNQQLYNQIIGMRKIASIVSVSTGIVALIWLVYLFVFKKNHRSVME